MAIVLSAIGLMNAFRKYQNFKRRKQHKKLIPYIELTEGSYVKKFERFGEYAVRQLCLTGPHGYSRLMEIAEEHLRGDESSSTKTQEIIYSYLSSIYTKEEVQPLCAQLLHELDSCILSYFAFHWEHSKYIIDQVLHGNSNSKKLRSAILSAAGSILFRKQRFKLVMKTLKIYMVFSTLLDIMKAIANHQNITTRMNVAVPVDAKMRMPVLLLIGGGMGVGKSTVVKDILKSPFWSGAAENAVVVEADAFKKTDVVYQALNSCGHDDLLETSELVHQVSTDAAASLLVTALNEGRDVIFDGTMSWEPFVLQTIAMARDVHCRRYRMGPGYQVRDDGSILEKYWQAIENTDSVEGAKMTKYATENNGVVLSSEASGIEAIGQSHVKLRKPYRIELVGVICDAHLAVVRGFRRAIITKRAVRIKEQLKSHKRFAASLPRYYEMVDHGKLYSTNSIRGPPKIIGWKEENKELFLIPDAIEAVNKLIFLNEDASSIDELYNSPTNGNNLDKVWKDLLSSERESRQQQLRNEIQCVENYLLKKKMSDISFSSISSSLFSSSDFKQQSLLDSSADFSRQASVHSQKTSKDGMEPDSFTDPSHVAIH